VEERILQLGRSHLHGHIMSARVVTAETTEDFKEE